MILNPVTLSFLSLSCAACSGALGVMVVPKLKKFLVPEPRATFLSDLLQFDSILDDNITIQGKDGTLTQTLHVKGVDLSIKTSNEIESLLSRRQGWLDLLSEMGASFKVITLRNEHEIKFPSGDVHPVLEKIHNAWMKNFSQAYENRHYIVITHYPKKEKGIKGLLGLVKEGANLAVLNELVAITRETLHDYDIEILDNGQECFSPLLTFWSELINGECNPVRTYKDHLSEHLVSNVLHFDNSNGWITYQNGSVKKFSATISLKTWGEVSSAALLKDILAIPGNIRILQLCKGYSKFEGNAYLKYQRDQSQLLFKNATTDSEFENAVDLVNNRESNLYTYQLSIFFQSSSITDLEEKLSEAKKCFRHYGFTPIIETMATEWLWRNQFPGLDHFVRPSHPMSHNLAHMMSFDREPVGLSRSDWGEGPIRLFKTATDSAYSLQLHTSDVHEALAHSLVVAPAGSGKTTLFQHLIGGALRHSKLRAYIFDRLNGTRIFTQAIGGTYVDLSSEHGVPLNPFVCNDTTENRSFLQSFMLMMAGVDDSESQDIISRSIELLFKVHQDKRVLNNLLDSLVDVNSNARVGLQKWTGNNPLSRWFNGVIVEPKGERKAYDALNLDSDRLVSFEMTEVQSTPMVAAAVTHYIMHRIRSAVRATAAPHMVFIDEARPMLTDPVFSQNVAVLFLEHRKLRGSINICFQDPGSIFSSGIGAIILDQCPTRFLFPNPSAEYKDYEVFNLTESEWEYIKGLSRVSRLLKRSVLVKKQNESVILNIDLSSMGPLMQLYRSGSEPLLLVRELQQQWGMNGWVEKYLNLSS